MVGVIVLVGTLGVYANANNPVAASNSSDVPGEAGLAITTTSGKAELALAAHLKQVGAKMYGAFWCPHCHDQKQALAAHLKQVGAKMYGAFWCPHCHDQKQLFGREAVSQINYIECDPEGKNPQPGLCQAANVQSYPSWEIKGQSVSGTQTLEELAQLSGYRGPRNFKNAVPQL